MSIFSPIYGALPGAKRKLAAEALAAGLAAVLVVTMLSHMARPDALSQSAGATDAQVREFMERVALSHVASLRAAAAAPAVEVGTNAPTPAAIVGAPPPAAAPALGLSPARKAPHPARVAMLPPPRPLPKLAAIIPAVAATAPPATQATLEQPAPSAPPLRYGMRFVATFVDFVAASDRGVVAGAQSAGDRLASLVKTL